MKRCHYITHDGDRIHIPGCTGGAVKGPSHCTCSPKSGRWNAKRLEELSIEVERLAEKVGILARSVRKFKQAGSVKP